ncbi:hypothetical protein ACFVYJ_06610 [Pontibacter sp. JAM-7]|uniref:hypothetical protein n=1 Tax=Pontibacter sp. JAM-7 TaxID=3366581 RepID=UPI003AF6D15F
MLAYDNIHKSIGILFFVLALFPWVSFGLNSFDSQPWYIVVGVFFLLLSTPFIKFSFYSFFAFLVLATGVFLSFVYSFFVSPDFFLLLRGVFSYVGFGLSVVCYFVFCSRYSAPVFVFLIANSIYLFVALLQALFDFDFSYLLNQRTTLDRGVPSLTPEPTYFGILLVFMSWLYIYNSWHFFRYVRVLLFLNLLFIFFVAQSSMAILYVILFGIVAFLFRLNFKFFLFFVGFVLLSFFVLYFFGEGTRPFRLITYFLDGGLLGLIERDASINFRVSSVFLPYFSIWQNFFMPGGFAGIYQYSFDFFDFFNGFFWYGSHVKIMSFFGAFLFELGIFGLFFWVLVFFRSIISYRVPFATVICLFLILNSAIPVAFPLVGFLVAAFAVNRQQIN